MKAFTVMGFVAAAAFTAACDSKVDTTAGTGTPAANTTPTTVELIPQPVRRIDGMPGPSTPAGPPSIGSGPFYQLPQ
jgi:hypothetical protein